MTRNMNPRRRALATLFAMALCLFDTSNTSAATLEKYVRMGGQLRGGHRREYQIDEHKRQEEPKSLCNRVIAVGRTMQRDLDASSPSDGSDDNIVISFEDEDTIAEEEEWARVGAEDAVIALPIGVTDNGDGNIDVINDVFMSFEDEDFHASTHGDEPFLARDDTVRTPYKGKTLEFDTDEEFVCELHDGSILPISAAQEQLVELRAMLNNGTLISAQSSIETDHIGNTVSSIGADGFKGNDITKVNEENDTETLIIEKFVALPPGTIRVINNDNGSSTRRRLNQYEGTKKTLIVRVTDSKGNSVPEDADFISSKFFGSDDDLINMRSGFKACTFDKFDMTPDYEDAIEKEDEKLSAEGVVEVTIDKELSKLTQGQMWSIVEKAVEDKLDVNLPGPFDHVVFVLEKCYKVGDEKCGWAAYAYINHWLSVFVEDNYKKAAVQMHEIGHNLNLAHSKGLDGRTYSDHTCLMGNPLWGDDLGKMCFNPVKNFQIAKGENSWYNDEHVQVWNSGEDGGTSLSSRLIGVAEYDKASANDLIVLKLETGHASDYFIGFNRKTRQNSQVKEAPDEVTIHMVLKGDGKAYSYSVLEDNLKEGQSMVIENWRDTNKDLVITATKIDTDGSLGYADVKIEFGPQHPTSSPTKWPSSSPSKKPTGAPTGSPTREPTQAPTVPPPTGSPTQPPPTTSPTPPQPSRSPTSAPTASPSKSPTKFPTASPIDDPCGNSVCETDENPVSCPADCIAENFKTKENADANTGGQMFRVKATNSDAVITSFEIEGKKDGESEVRIYTRQDDYQDHVEDSAGWVKVFDKKVQVSKNERTNLELLDEKVTIPAGSTHSFYVFSKKNMLYKKGNGNRGAFDGDGVLTMMEGIGTKKLFEEPTGSGKFSGGIRYYTSAGRNGPSPPGPTTPGPSPPGPSPPGKLKTFNTDSKTDADSGGQMFTIKAKAGDITIKSFDIFGKKDSTEEVKIYTRQGSYEGHEYTESEWELIFDEDVELEKNVLSDLKGLAKDVTISAGLKQAFYIWSKKGMLYTEVKEKGVNFDGDDALAVYTGIAIKNLFQKVVGNAEFRGRISYHVPASP